MKILTNEELMRAQFGERADRPLSEATQKRIDDAVKRFGSYGQTRVINGVEHRVISVDMMPEPRTPEPKPFEMVDEIARYPTPQLVQPNTMQAKYVPDLAKWPDRVPRSDVHPDTWVQYDAATNTVSIDDE